MTAFTLAHTAPTATQPRDRSPTPPRPDEARRAKPRRQPRKEEADRAFDAAVRWFLAVSRAA